MSKTITALFVLNRALECIFNYLYVPPMLLKVNTLPPLGLMRIILSTFDIQFRRRNGDERALPQKAVRFAHLVAHLSHLVADTVPATTTFN